MTVLRCDALGTKMAIKIRSITLLVFLSLLSPSLTSAAITFNGNGCLPGSTSAAIDGDGNAIISLNLYSINLEEKLSDNRDCNISWHIEVPPGYKALSGDITIEGKHTLESQEVAKLSGNSIFAGQNRWKFSKTLKGWGAGAFESKHRPSFAPSACGKSFDIILTTNIKATASTITHDHQQIEVTRMFIQKPRLIKCSLR